MWNYVSPPPETKDSGKREKFIEQFAAEKMRAYDGTVFFCISRSDRERRLTLRQAAQALGHTAKEGRFVGVSAERLAERPGRNVLFVEPSMQRYLGEYLNLCPAGMRHLLIYSRRRGNGPSPHMSAFLDFWLERGVDIWDLRDVDEQEKSI